MPRLLDQDDGVEKLTPDILSLPADVFLLVTDAILEAETLDMNQGVGKGLTIYDHIKFFGKGEFWWQSWDQVELNWGAFDRWKDLARFGATCKTLYLMVIPILYRSDAKYNYSSALMISARKGVLSGVLRSLEYGKADPNMDDHTLFFHWARVHGVSQKLPPLKISRECILPSLTPLHLACFYDHPEIVEALLNHQADINKRAHAWCTREIEGPYRPYDQDVMFGVTKREFVADKQTHSPMPLFGANALFFAFKATQYNCDCSGKKISAHKPRCFVYANSYEGCTKWAFMEGLKEIKKDAIAHDAKAVMKGSHTWDIDTVIRLCQAGCDLITRQYGSLHALHQACAYGLVEVAEYLIRGLHVDPNVRDNNGLTPLHYMAINQETLWEDIDFHEVDVDQMERTFFLLLAYGANVNAKTNSGVTAIQDALRSPDGLHLACLLLWNGCKWDPEYEAILDRNRRAHEEDKREIRRTLRYIRINGPVKGYRFLADEGQDA